MVCDVVGILLASNLFQKYSSYDSEEPDCGAFIAIWETVAHKLRGLVNVGKVDTSVSDDVTERFKIDNDNPKQCPTFLLYYSFETKHI